MIALSAAGADLRFVGDAIWKVLIASLMLGAGLPAVFALGVRALAWSRGHTGDSGAGEAVTAPRGNPLGVVVAVLAFAVVAYVLAVGIEYVVVTGHGKELKFDGLWPTAYKKS